MRHCAPVEVAQQPDILARREHLLARTLSPTYFDDHSLTPGGIYAAEWQLVTLSMTAAALTNIAFSHPSTRAQARSACRQLIDTTLTPAIRAFELQAWRSDPLEDLSGPNGHVGYLGHLNFMLGAYRVLGGDMRHAALHAAISDTIARRMRASVSHHLPTYPGKIFTADNSVAVASLALYDMVTGACHAREIDDWVAYTRAHLRDPENGIVVFAVDRGGQALGRGRGSAAGYNAFYLPFIDPTFAAEQRARVSEHMLVDMPFGGVALREFVTGGSPLGDVDSGPLFFGVSPSATGFYLAGARHAGDDALALGLLRTAEMAGFSAPCSGGICYLTAPLVGDAIVLAMRTAIGWDARWLPPSPSTKRCRGIPPVPRGS